MRESRSTHKRESPVSLPVLASNPLQTFGAEHRVSHIGQPAQRHIVARLGLDAFGVPASVVQLDHHSLREGKDAFTSGHVFSFLLGFGDHRLGPSNIKTARLIAMPPT